MLYVLRNGYHRGSYVGTRRGDVAFVAAFPTQNMCRRLLALHELAQPAEMWCHLGRFDGELHQVHFDMRPAFMRTRIVVDVWDDDFASCLPVTRNVGILRMEESDERPGACGTLIMPRPCVGLFRLLL